MVHKFLFFLTFLLLFSEGSIKAQKAIDLHKILSDHQLKVYNRQASPGDVQKAAVLLNAGPGEGVAWIEGLSLGSGKIEVDLKGKDKFQKSFVGIAFHGSNDTTYEAIYFRPFNFHAKDSVRRIHAVQYISHPEFPWKKLRDEKNGQFEKEVNPKPDPNNWFHASIVISETEISVYVDHAKIPSLKVARLSKLKEGNVGLWVGDGGGGEFSSLSLSATK